MLRTYDARPDVRKEFEERTGIDLTDLMPDKFDISELTVNVPTAFALGMNLNKLETQIGYLMAMEWLVIRPVQKGVFITSDSPVYWTNLDYKGEPVGGGWASEDLLITCPLSRELAVIVCWDGGKPFKTLTTRKMDVVPMINQYTFLGAEKLLIASSLKFAGADKINQKLLEKSSSK
jgi:hypothetical protein